MRRSWFELGKKFVRSHLNQYQLGMLAHTSHSSYAGIGGSQSRHKRENLFEKKPKARKGFCWGSSGRVPA
jgi:hypothetical protein